MSPRSAQLFSDNKPFWANDMRDNDRDERAKRVSQQMIDLERTAREAKTARLRKQRLAQAAPESETPPGKPKRPLKAAKGVRAAKGNEG